MGGPRLAVLPSSAAERCSARAPPPSTPASSPRFSLWATSDAVACCPSRSCVCCFAAEVFRPWRLPAKCFHIPACSCCTLCLLPACSCCMSTVFQRLQGFLAGTRASPLFPGSVSLRGSRAAPARGARRPCGCLPVGGALGFALPPGASWSAVRPASPFPPCRALGSRGPRSGLGPSGLGPALGPVVLAPWSLGRGCLRADPSDGSA